MDIIQSCLSYTPIPYLDKAFSVFSLIYSSVQQVWLSQQQLQTLSQTTAHLLMTLNEQIEASKLSRTQVERSIPDLCRLLDEILDFVRSESAKPFLTQLFTKEFRISQINNYHQRTTFIGLVQEFQMLMVINIQNWQSRNEQARKDDQRLLFNYLLDLEKNYRPLLDVLPANENNTTALMIALQRHVEKGLGGDREQMFYRNALASLSTASKITVQLEDWMVTSYDVEFKHQIGSGGFGEVYRGMWNKTEIALKVFGAKGGIKPSSASIQREIKIWSSLRHPNVLQFLGANHADDRPFIVMQYMPNGNAHDFLQNHPHIDPINIFNILINQGGNAVLCDFGLSRLKADVTSRMSASSGGINFQAGSRHWTSPERLQGGTLRKPADVYSFGMTVFEIYTGEIPLFNIDPGEFRQLVVHEDIRPEQPEKDEAPHMTKAIWVLAQECWVKDPGLRPTATALNETITQLLQLTPSSSPSYNDILGSPVSSASEETASRAALEVAPLSSAVRNTPDRFRNNQLLARTSTIRLFRASPHRWSK